MDSTDPDIFFNVMGQCNHCIHALKILSQYRQLRVDSNRILEMTIEEIKRHPGKDGFHAIIGVSGGVDSSYLLHLLRDSGLRLLAVHVDAGWNSIESVRNIGLMINALNLELETVVIDWNEIKNLQIAYLRSGLINQDVPQDHAFFASLSVIAQELDIKYFLSGSNYATESILPSSWGQNAMDGKQILDVYRKYGKGRLAKYPILTLHKLYWRRYISKNYRVVAPLNYVNYSKAIAIEELRENYGWKEYGGKHRESRFTEFFQEVYLPERFGIKKKRAHLSSLIVLGELTRDSALEELVLSDLSYLDKENLKTFVATKLDMSSQELQKLINLPYVSESVFKNEKYLQSYLRIAIKFRDLFRKLRNIEP